MVECVVGILIERLGVGLVAGVVRDVVLGVLVDLATTMTVEPGGGVGVGVGVVRDVVLAVVEPASAVACLVEMIVLAVVLDIVLSVGLELILSHSNRVKFSPGVLQIGHLVLCTGFIEIHCCKHFT